MSKKNSELKKLLFLVVMLIGSIGLLYGNGTTLLIGFLLAIGAVVGMVVLARRENALPLDQDEREIWESIRAQGKRRYILRSMMHGLFLGLLFLVYQLIKSLWSDESFDAGTGFLLIALFLILYIGASYAAAIKEWALYEERYKESLPQGPQHNK
ncbi:MAG TPA: hypothetical protein VFD48_03950 [Pyrinomonadaceae bacterium]|nr:hypothetical protein [Pyrinomonadaceae bacterium]